MFFCVSLHVDVPNLDDSTKCDKPIARKQFCQYESGFFHRGSEEDVVTKGNLIDIITGISTVFCPGLILIFRMVVGYPLH